MRYHDFHLDGYTVRDSGATIELHLGFERGTPREEESHIVFSEVSCYHFTHIDRAIIVEINEVPIREVVKKEEAFLSTAAYELGLRHWRTGAEDFATQLEKEGLSAWTIDSAIGFAGFVIARSVTQKVKRIG